MGGQCCGVGRNPAGGKSLPKLVLMGTPNVGKSALFNALTGAYVTVSNYPGTTVEITRGRAVIGGRTWEIVDTPGMYSLIPITEEERVARAVLLEGPDLVLHVVDAKNLPRLLPLTLQLLEAGLPLILVVNMLDEARKYGLRVDLGLLERRLGVPVVGTAAAAGIGVNELKARIAAWVQARPEGQRRAG